MQSFVHIFNLKGSGDMTAPKKVPSDKTVRKWMYSAIPLMFILGGLTHFLYKLSGENVFVGIFCPVNESVWEHLKISFWVPLAWWIITYLRKSKSYSINAAKWFSCCAAALYIAPLVICAFYYTYTGALGIHSLILDIFSLLLGLATAQIAAFHFYKYGKFKESCLKFSMIAVLILAAAFVIFTFLTPQLPIFLDPVTGIYGIR